MSKWMKIFSITVLISSILVGCGDPAEHEDPEEVEEVEPEV